MNTLQGGLMAMQVVGVVALLSQMICEHARLFCFARHPIAHGIRSHLHFQTGP